jgi:uncharacterized damage-inducible protein DinB
MNLTELATLFDYHYWARDRVLDAADTLTPAQFTQPVPSSFSSVRDTLVHIYGADWIWCARWEGQSPTVRPEPSEFPDVASIRQVWTTLEHRVRALMAGLGEEGIRRPIQYRTTEGQPNVQLFWQIAQHVVNHGSYHRGQVTTLLRQVGAAPPKSTDLIAFIRERAAAGRT